MKRRYGKETYTLPLCASLCRPQDMLAASGPTVTREIMDAQEFKLPALFTQKEDALKFLEDNDLWILQPGMMVTSIIEPKLKVMHLYSKGSVS